MKNIQISYWLFLIAVLYYSPNMQAQFDGGFGEGSYKSSTIQINLNGGQINPLILYRGGDGDGQNKAYIVASLSGAELSALYNGGFGDGSAKLSFQGTLVGDELSDLYLGGVGDGHHKISFSGVLDGAEIGQLYQGGEGDGHNKFDFSGLLDGAEIAQLYRGGNGDGHDKMDISTLLNGDLLDQLYAGGIGDGHDKEFFAGTLDGSMLSALYSGGIGDGFSKNMIQYIFDFPDCTFVVNTADDGFGSLRYAIDCAAPGDTIGFSSLLINDNIQLALGTGPLLISKDIYIDANPGANLTVDGSLLPNSIVAGINGMSNITIKGLNIIAGFDPFGSAILNGGTLTLEDLDITNTINNTTTVIATFNGGSLIIKGTVQLLEN